MKIEETQEESEKDDEIIFKLLIDEKLVSWAKTTLYSTLESIHTARQEKRKGYGTKLLAFMEQNAKNHCSTAMRTSNFEQNNKEATKFFNVLGYKLKTVTDEINAPLKGIKSLE